MAQRRPPKPQDDEQPVESAVSEYPPRPYTEAVTPEQKEALAEVGLSPEDLEAPPPDESRPENRI